MANTLYLNIPQVSANQNQKEVTINSGIAALEAALCSSLIITFASANVTLSATQFAGNIMFRVQGTLTGNSLIFPATVGGNPTNRLICVTNETTTPVTLSMGTGTTVSLPGGVNAFVYVNGAVGCVLLATSASLASLIVKSGTTTIDTATANLTFSSKFVVTDTSPGSVSLDINASVLGSLSYEGTWNASTNVPALESSVGTKGYFYTVATAGTTALDGITQWNVGDKAIFDGTVWEKIDGVANEVTSVAGRTGNVVLAVADVAGAAPLANADLTGATVTTPAATDNSTKIPNTSWVAAYLAAQGYVTATTTPVTSVNGMTGVVTGLEQTSNKAAANGYASLDGSGKVPLAQLPAAVAGALSYQGTWDASANVPALASSTGTKGYFYTVATAGSTTLDGISTWSVGDKAVFDGTVWEKIDGIANEVLSVAGMTGNVTLTVANVTGAAPLDSAALTGAPTTPAPPVADNSTRIPNTAWVAAYLAAQGYVVATAVPVTSVNGMTGAVVGLEQTSNKGVANGYAGLDGGGKVPIAQLPAAVAGALSYQGTWNAATNAPALASSTGTKGYFYTVATAGTTTLDGYAVWSVGDKAVFNGATWEKIDGVANEVLSVAGRTGNVVLSVSDVSGAAPLSGASLTGATSASTLAANDNSTNIPSTAWVTAFVAALGYVTLSTAPVTSVNGMTGAVVGLEQTANKAAANGYASLDGSGKVPLAQLPAAVAGALSYQGTWNASTNAPALVSSTGTKGYFYTVSTAGATTLDGISQWNVGDNVAFNGTVWEKIDGVANEVLSVAGMTGAVTLTAANIGGLGALAPLNVGTGLTSTSGSLTVSYGAAAGTAAQGNDTRITGAEQTANKNAVNGYCGLDSSGLIPWAQMRPEVQNLPLAFIIPTLPTSGQVYNLVVATAVTIPANFAGTVVYETTLPTANAVFTVNHISSGTTTQIGTITITSASHTTALLSTQAAVSLAVGDVLQLVAPTPQDTTLANVGITILAAKV
jgi:hypothetical protein